MQYTSMNTLVYADVSGPQTGGASTIAATGQQLAISFGVAGAALIAAIFVPPALHSHPDAIIHGAQQAFLALGILTILSSVVFMELRADDGEGMSRHDAAHRQAPHNHAGDHRAVSDRMGTAYGPIRSETRALEMLVIQAHSVWLIPAGRNVL
jgi:hypothetical protein